MTAGKPALQFCEKGPRLCEVALWVNASHLPARTFLTAYDVGMWMRGELNPDNSAGTSNVEVAYYNSSNVEIGRDVVVSHDPGDLDQTWAEYHGIVTTPANTASLRVWVTNELNSGWVNYDDAYVIPQDGVKTTVHYQLAGQSVAVAVGADVSYVFSDHLGSTATSWNATSGASSQYYLPFGGVRHSDGLPSDVGYTGQKLDASTGLMFYNARYYDPLIGRFISADTIVPNPLNPQAWNRYSYVRNSPLNFTDPSGHFDCSSGLCEDLLEGAGELVSEVEQFLREVLEPPVAPPVFMPPTAPWYWWVAPFALAEEWIHLMENLNRKQALDFYLWTLDRCVDSGDLQEAWLDCRPGASTCGQIPVFRITDSDPASKNGAYWGPINPLAYEKFAGCGPDYCGAVNKLALPPNNRYDMLYQGLVDIADIIYVGTVRELEWKIDGTTLDGGGIEFIIPGGCFVVSCRKGLSLSPPIWPK